MKLFIVFCTAINNIFSIKTYFDSLEKDVNYLEYPDNLTEYMNLIKNIPTADNNKIIIFTTYGVGEFLVSNKFNGIRASIIVDEFTANSSISHNNVQIAIFPLSIISSEYAITLSKILLNSGFNGGRHNIRITMLEKLD